MLNRLQAGDSLYRGPLSASQWNEIVDAAQRGLIGPGAFYDGTIAVTRQAIGQKTLRFKASGATVIARGVFVDNGVDADDLEILTARQTTVTGERPIYVSLDDVDVTVGSISTYREPGGSPVLIAYDTADGTPAVGECWGPIKSSYKLRKGVPGFKVIKAGASGLVWCQYDAADIFHEFTIPAGSTMSSGSSVASCQYRKRTGSGYADLSGLTETIYAPEELGSGKTIVQNKHIKAIWIMGNNRLEIPGAAEC